MSATEAIVRLLLVLAALLAAALGVWASTQDRSVAGFGCAVMAAVLVLSATGAWGAIA